jgi:sugar O-acyltransferase (sialic acid O-acetyltransferase NeuD family)
MDVVIIGAGGHGRVVLEAVRTGGQHRCVGFLDQDPAVHGTKVDGVTVLGPANQLLQLRQQRVGGAVIAIGDNRARLRYVELVRQHGLELPTIVHPSATVAGTATLGEGCLVAAGVIVATGARVGRASILNTGCVVDHECELEAGVHVCPGALLAGRVRVGEGAMIGLGAKVIQCLSIGAGATVGAGAVVIRDVAEGSWVVGVPAHVLRERAGSEAA